MNLENQQIRKTRPLREEPHFYQPGDIVLGKCINHPPWPCEIKHFHGYDEDEVQVFYVEFFGTNERASLQTYLMTRITKTKLKNIKTKNYYRTNVNFRKSIRVAQARIKAIEQQSRQKVGKAERFIKLYCQDKQQCDNFYDVEQLRMQSRGISKQQKRQQKMSKLQTQQIMGISIKVSIQKDLYFRSVFQTNEDTLSSLFKKPKTQISMAHEQIIQISIVNWQPKIFQRELE